MSEPDASGQIRTPTATNIVWHEGAVSREERRGLSTDRGWVIWLTGLSGSGKSTIAVELERQLVSRSRAAYLLDGDNLRHGLNFDLGFSAADRDENVRRVGEVAILFADAGVVSLVPLVSPYRSARDAVRERAAAAGVGFMEVHVATALEVCEERDTKGLYAKARSGEVRGLTGVDDPYEAPLHPEVFIDTLGESPAKSAQRVFDLLDLQEKQGTGHPV